MGDLLFVPGIGTAEALNDLQFDSLGRAVRDISTALVHAQKKLCGKGATKARTHVFGDLAFCVLEGGFARGDQTLIEGGERNLVAAHRSALNSIGSESFVAIIEGHLGRRVRSFMSASDPTNELQTLVFVLEPRQQNDRDAEPRALREKRAQDQATLPGAAGPHARAARR